MESPNQVIIFNIIIVLHIYLFTTQSKATHKSILSSFRPTYTRVVHGSDGPAGRHDFAGFWRVGSALRNFQSFLLIISGFLNQCESSNTAFELMVFL